MTAGPKGAAVLAPTPEERADERSHFRGRLRAAGQSRNEHVRSSFAEMGLEENYDFHHLPPTEVIAELYGADGVSHFWHVECSEPVEPSRFIRIVALMTASNVVEFQGALFGLADALSIASKVNPEILVGDMSQTATMSPDDWIDASRPRIYVRQLTEWLLNMPKRAPLVPPSLAAYVRGEPDKVSAPLLKPEMPKLRQNKVDAYKDRVASILKSGGPHSIYDDYAWAETWAKQIGIKEMPREDVRKLRRENAREIGRNPGHPKKQQA